MKNFVQVGTRITHTPTADVASGAAIAVGDRVFVACGAIAANTAGELLTEGVVELPKTTGTAIAQGKKVYVTAAGVVTVAASGNKVVGYAWQAAAAAAETIEVKLGA